MDEFLAWVKGKAKVYFDVKFAHPQQLIDLIYSTGFENDCFLWSGSKEWMRLCAQLAPELPLKINVGDVAGVQDAHTRFGASIVEVSPENLNADLIGACHDLGIRVMARAQQESAQIFGEILAWEIDLINLDDPELFLAVLGA